MDLSFWHERWAAGAIGFHEATPNSLLVKWAHRLPPQARVLVPLCGKAVDMAYLASRGHAVVGVEAVRTACEHFFVEQGIARTEEPLGPFVVHRGAAAGVEIWQGDMFAATPTLLGRFDAAYDRAALVALDPATRARYVETLRGLLAPGARLLLVTFSYDQARVEGPPFSVPQDAIVSLAGDLFDVELLETHAARAAPRMQSAGLSTVEESITLLTRR